jgi:hypothetical protein
MAYNLPRERGGHVLEIGVFSDDALVVIVALDEGESAQELERHFLGKGRAGGEGDKR